MAMWNILIRIAGFIGALALWMLACACADSSRAEENLLITEVMAANAGTLRDQEGESPDWIEIYNPNRGAVNLDGWFLTNDPGMPAKWRFPSVRLNGRSYLVVFASKKNRAYREGDLHTNFTLDRDGGFLALVKPDGVTISFQFTPAFPPQVTDVSFGLDPAALRPPVSASSSGGAVPDSGSRTHQWRYFATATPGAPNGDGFTGLSGAPRFAKPGGVFAQPVTVGLEAPAAGAVVRYTTDGSEPNAGSPVYSAPFEIAATAMVKARAFERGLAPGPVISRTYTIVDESLAGFTSNLPLVIIDAVGRRLGRETKTPVALRVIDTGGNRAALTNTADFDGEARIHLRGYTSMRHPKKSFALKTTDEAGDSAKASILGLPADSDWILYAPYPDKTLMRDVLAYELSNQMGHYAPRTRFVELFFSRVGGRLSARDYLGVYVFEEKIKRGKQRVNIAVLQPGDNSAEKITGGYIFKKDHPEKRQPGFMTSRGNQFFYVEPKGEEITPAQQGWLNQHLNQFERALYGSSFKDPERGYPAFIDPGSFIDHFWIVEATKNIDGFRFSTFFQIDRGGKIKIEPIWDWNLSLGNAEGRGGYEPSGWYHETLDDRQYSWYPRLFEDPDFGQRRVDRWAELRRDLFSTGRLLKRVDELAAQLHEAQERNFQRWPILGQRVHPNFFVGDSYEEEVGYMKTWIQRRMAWIDRQFPSPPTLTRTNDEITLGARSGKIHFTLDGSDPRQPGGGISPRAQIYTKPIKAGGDLKITARVQLRETWSAPTVLP
jgi:hypothetical protein